MKKLLATMVLGLFLSGNAYANERSEKEIKIGVFLEDLKEIGKFKKIKDAPERLFDSKYKSFPARSWFAQSEVARIFVKQKGLLEKYPDRMMLGMAYFEYFYQQQLKDNKHALEKAKNSYPNLDSAQRNTIKKIYSLNSARKTMREALGLSLDDDPEKALAVYSTMSRLLKQSKITTVKLTKEEKKRIKLHNDIAKQLGKAKKIVKEKKEQRITDKKFNKEYSKIQDDLSRSLEAAESIKEYELLSSFVVELDNFDQEKISGLVSGYNLAEFIIKDLKKNNLKKKFIQDLSEAEFGKFNQEELTILGDITKSTKLQKNIKSNEIQVEILNLEDNGIPVNKLLDVYREDLGVKLDSLNLQLASATTMSKWVLSDWANAWKSPIPTKVQDAAGIEIQLSDQEVQSIKAQLAMQNFKEIIDVGDFKDIIDSSSEIADLKDTISEATKSFEFSFTLDDFARSFGSIHGFDISNYADLTALANAQHNANWSVEEYASAYQMDVDIVNQLQSGGLSSFDAGQIAEAAGASLQDVADTIIAASQAGVSVDLDATFQGMGYDDFAAAVAAYNAQHGTSYTVESAREALGQ